MEWRKRSALRKRYAFVPVLAKLAFSCLIHPVVLVRLETIQKPNNWAHFFFFSVISSVAMADKLLFDFCPNGETKVK